MYIRKENIVRRKEQTIDGILLRFRGLQLQLQIADCRFQMVLEAEWMGWFSACVRRIIVQSGNSGNSEDPTWARRGASPGDPYPETLDDFGIHSHLETNPGSLPRLSRSLFLMLKLHMYNYVSSHCTQHILIYISISIGVHIIWTKRIRYTFIYNIN